MLHIHLGHLFLLLLSLCTYLQIIYQHDALYRPVNNQDMTFFDVFPMELKACSGKLLAAATVHFLCKTLSMKE